MSELRLLPAEKLTLSAPPARPPGALPWQPGKPVQTLAEQCGPESGWSTLGQFSSWLLRAEVMDSRVIELPGAAVVLPYGCRLQAQFEATVRRRYEDAGYQEYDYPLLVPPSVLEPSGQVLELGNALLHAGNDQDWVADKRRAVLTPTGEGVVSTHWSQLVHSADQLPIRMYRRARYFRPAASGGNVFRAMESTDVYEFQACHASAADSATGMLAGLDMLRSICDDLHVPVLWSTRPPWTNNASVAEVAVGGDVPLPHGATVQVACVYDQGERFSRPYGVRLRSGSTARYAQHVAGCVSRRLLLAHLFLGMDTDGDLLVHPDLAPIQLAVTLASGRSDDQAMAQGLVRALTANGIRARLEIAPDKRAVGRLHRQWRRQGIPLRLYLQPARTAEERLRVVVVRADTRQEAALLVDSPASLVSKLPAALAEVGAGYAHRSYGFVARQCVAAKESVRNVLARRSVAVCPLAPVEEVIRTVGSWRLGEVLGLLDAGQPGVCAVSGRPTTAIGYLSPRT
jgi:prolyl-tRNA synthetase